mmetsp:Transcript_3799/g.11794  ORF Transcript_3799/g.11794 Transcript_3799/m.11794 type:complete len:309 (-) Transcript_3799:45-971(-)
MGKKSRKKPQASPAPASNSLTDAFAGPNLELEWPQTTRGLGQQERSALIQRYKAAVLKLTPRAGTEHRVFGLTKGLLSLRLIGATMPLIDRCDFFALQEFEARHPELFADAEALPARREDVIDPRDALKQMDAFHRVFTSRHRAEIDAIIQPLRAEREAARAPGGNPDRCPFLAPFTAAYADELRDRFSRDADAAAIVCPNCAATQPERDCESMTMQKKDRTGPPEPSNIILVVCKVAQQTISRADRGKTPKFRFPDGKTIVRCTQCNALGSETLKLRACARCKSVWYCSTACQTTAWPAHKKTCRAA